LKAAYNFPMEYEWDEVGSGRKSFGDLVRLKPDVVAAFPDAVAVNEALHSLNEIAKRSTRST
jgi:hypothetical protein